MPNEQPGVELLRPLGLHERYCSARDNVKAPPLLCFVALTRGQSLELQSHLEDRIGLLLAAYPLLSCFIHEPRSREPKFASKGTVQISEVFRTTTSSSPLSFAELVNAEIEGDVSPIELTSAPLWRVQLVQGPDAEELAIMLTVHHTIADGRGAANLFELLLGTGQIAGPSSSLPPASEKVLDLRPSWSYMVPIIFREVFLPKFPAFVQSLLETSAVWPTETKKLPIDAQKSVRFLTFEGAVQPLKKLGAHHGVKTLNPLLHTVCQLACLATAGVAEIQVESETPINQRRSEQENVQTKCTGNYVADLQYSSLVQRSCDFWELTRQFASEITSPWGQTKARYTIGLLSYIPDTPRSPEELRSESPTGWEKYLNDKHHDTRQPFRITFGLSNLGRITLPRWVKEVGWSQRIGNAAAFTVDVCGLSHAKVADEDAGEEEAGGAALLKTNDLTISIGLSEGVLDREKEALFIKTVDAIISWLIQEGEKASGNDEASNSDTLTLEEMIKAVAA